MVHVMRVLTCLLPFVWHSVVWHCLHVLPCPVSREDARLLVAAMPGGGGGEVDDRSRSRSPPRASKCRVQPCLPDAVPSLPQVQRLDGNLWALNAQSLRGEALMSCESMPLGACGQNGHDESNEHCFRCFAFHGRLLRIREEISSADMPTGGRLWDAGIFLAHWLASFGPEPVEFKGKAGLKSPPQESEVRG